MCANKFQTANLLEQKKKMEASICSIYWCPFTITTFWFSAAITMSLDRDLQKRCKHKDMASGADSNWPLPFAAYHRGPGRTGQNFAGKVLSRGYVKQQGQWCLQLSPEVPTCQHCAAFLQHASSPVTHVCRETSPALINATAAWPVPWCC